MNRTQAIAHLTWLSEEFVEHLAQNEGERVEIACDTTHALRALGVSDEELVS